ncbi:MAG TPA: hypothetical protein VF838_15840 [Trebonia sp.]
MTTQAANEDGSEVNLVEHLSHVHQQGTRGFTDDYLANLHKMLHQRKREPLPEHTHPEDEPVEI